MRRSRSFRRAAPVGAVMLALGLLTACAGGAGGTASPSGAPAAPSSAAPGEKVELTMWNWAPGVDAAVALWNSKNPDVQVKLEKIPSGATGGYAKMQAALKAGTGAPDLAQMEYQEIPNFLLSNGLVDLSTVGAAADKDKFVEWQWNQVSFGTGVYGVPQASGPMAFFYRADLFAKWGIAPPATWDDFKAAAAKIRAKNSKAYISTFPPGNSAWFASLASQAGAKWFGATGDTWTVNVDSPETLKVAQFWDGMVKDKLVKTDPDFANGWYKDLQDGNIVGWVSAQWGDGILYGNAPATKGKWRVAPMPQWSKDGPFTSANWGGSSTAVLTGTKHAQQAKDFALWLNTDKASVDLLIKGGYGWPAGKDALAGSALDKPYAFFGGQKINDVFAAADAAVDKNWKWLPTTAATYQHLNDGFQRVVAGQGSFVDVVKQAQQQSLADLKAKGLKGAAG